MIKHDIISGLLYGVVLGLFFASELTSHLPLLVLLAVFYSLRMISIK